MGNMGYVRMYNFSVGYNRQLIKQLHLVVQSSHDIHFF